MRSMEKPPYTMRVPRKSEPEYYLDQVLPILLRRRVRLRSAINMSIDLYLSELFCFQFCMFFMMKFLYYFITVILDALMNFTPGNKPWAYFAGCAVDKV